MQPHPDDFKPALSLIENATARVTAKALSGTIHDISEFSVILPLRLGNGDVASNGHRTRVAVSRYPAPDGKEGPAWDIMVFDDNAQAWGESNFYIGILANGGQTFMCIWYYAAATGVWLDSQKLEPRVPYKLPPCAVLILGDGRWSKNGLVLELRSKLLQDQGGWNGFMPPHGAYGDFHMGLPIPPTWPAQYMPDQAAMAPYPPPHMQQYPGYLVPGNFYQMQSSHHGPENMMYHGHGLHIGYAFPDPNHTGGQGGGNWSGGWRGGNTVQPRLAGHPRQPPYHNGKHQRRALSERSPPTTGWSRNYPNFGRGCDNMKKGGFQGQGTRGRSGSRGSPPFGPNKNGSNMNNNGKGMHKRKVSVVTSGAEHKKLAAQPSSASSAIPKGPAGQLKVSDIRVVVAYVDKELTMGKTASEPPRLEAEDGFELGGRRRRASVSTVLDSPMKEDDTEKPCIAQSYTYE